ncbi:MAG: UDP-N-acetylmuramate dehydrogenase [Deltaproteobacteria bacterium]|nr:UDP-N-acetylmuramate dehydrogenase [Deltaproteobacteria bacterium]
MTLDPQLKKQLQHLDGVEADWDIILAGHTSLRVGGPVSCLLRPLDLAGLQTAVQVLNQKHHPYFILGRGTNLLVQDGGTKAVAISLEKGFSQVECIDPTGRVKAGAGLRLSRLLRFCLQQGLSGLEFIAGIPGSLGGALRMNAGTHAGKMADVCEAVYLLLSDGTLKKLMRTKLSFSYRRLELPPAAVVLGAELLLTPSSREQIRQRIRSLLEVRKEKQPWQLPSAGSVFKNPPGDFAGRLIEAVGLKGVRIGDAQISPKHANFIVNRGRARASDVHALIQLAQEKVSEEFGVQLELEIEVVGNNYNS